MPTTVLFSPPSCTGVLCAKVIYPGTFDPITNGHVDLIERSCRLFDTVVVAIASSKTQRSAVDVGRARGFAQRVLSHLNNVEVVGF